ncbi:MAG: GPW/gp25 family protein [Bacilli bacterium]
MKKIARSIAGGSHKKNDINAISGKEYYSDLDPAFSLDPTTNDLSKTVNVQAVQNSMIGIITTRKGSRAFEPEFGCDIPGSLFENMTDFAAYTIEKSIQEAIANYEPRVILKGVEVVPFYDDNSYAVTITYHIITDLNYIYNLKLRLKDEF